MIGFNIGAYIQSNIFGLYPQDFHVKFLHIIRAFLALFDFFEFKSLGNFNSA